MLLIRSVVFNTAFYANMILRMIVFAPYYFLASRKAAFSVPKGWASSSNWLMGKIVGATFEIEGLENIPEGGCIFTPKHQSVWDTFALMPHYPDPVYILKRELLWIPLFGWYLARQRMIPVNRGARGKVMVEVMKRTKEEMASGRQLIIYPEGTRRSPGAEPDYRYGIARIYRDAKVPVVPVVAHWGLFWGRRKLVKYPGHFKVRILPPIQPGMQPDAFYKHLIETLETASDQLLVETVAANPHVPLPPTAVKRLAELKAEQKTEPTPV
ncbi:1-acyl-sn-glycerol-3-phosphate acyltransferase [Rhizobium sp. CFBP 8752]|uniref:lysophospholipid acyltransferase family protein n=1 Tax=Rhizobium sp. CFBP 8752 TaxID=2775301 RepID=UPI00177DBD58|nr:lysophospholipid acyltransferase family protein [Rhizobium sp. CFBP 8752]MBD8661858.1 1-acyl-sn-glycerol-3-phosphate acyltransferase [Rhizobium sp. CFBP 8752]